MAARVGAGDVRALSPNRDSRHDVAMPTHHIHCEVSGSAGPAPTLLLVHGWGGDGDWQPLPAELRHPGPVVVPDLRGHGRSHRPREHNTPAAMAADLARLLRRRGGGPVVAVGHSMGGQVVTALAVTRPELVRAVVTLDPAYGADEQEAAGMRRRLDALHAQGARTAVSFVESAFAVDTPESVRRRQVRLMAAMPGHVLAQAYRGMYLDDGAFGVRARSEAYLVNRRCPALGVWSARQAAEWERTTLSHPYSEVHAWPDRGHYLHQERPAEPARLLERWVGGLPDAQP